MPAGFFIVYLNSTSSWYPSRYINTFSLSQFHPEYLLQFVPRGLAPVYRQLEGKDALTRQADNSVRREKHTCFETLWKTLEMQKDLNTELFKKVAEGIKEGGGEKRLIQQ